MIAPLHLKHTLQVLREHVSAEEIPVIVVLLHVAPALYLVDRFVLVVFELGVVAGDGAREVHLLELVMRLWQWLVVESKLPQQAMHVLVLRELPHRLGHEFDG